MLNKPTTYGFEHPHIPWADARCSIFVTFTAQKVTICKKRDSHFLPFLTKNRFFIVKR